MAKNESRSLNQSLNEGSTDGKYRKVRPNTTVAAGKGDELVRANRQDLHPYWNYDYIDQEDSTKVNPLATKAASSSQRVTNSYENTMGPTY